MPSPSPPPPGERGGEAEVERPIRGAARQGGGRWGWRGQFGAGKELERDSEPEDWILTRPEDRDLRSQTKERRFEVLTSKFGEVWWRSTLRP